MYVGSAGAVYLPTMFADRVVLPPELALDVSEKIVFMPDTFYFNSHPSSFPLSTAASCPPSERRRWNLPASGVVVLNHNQFYKFDRFSFYTMSDTLLLLCLRLYHNNWLHRCVAASVSSEGGAGRGTLWLKSETKPVHKRLSSVIDACHSCLINFSPPKF